MPLAIPGYRLGDRIGGFHSDVYTATDERGAEVVIKVRRDAPWFRAIQQRARVRSPNLATVHALGMIGDHYYAVLEPARGQPLADLEVCPDLRIVEGVMLGIASALAAYHQAGLIYGNLCGIKLFLDGATAMLLDPGMVDGDYSLSERWVPDIKPYRSVEMLRGQPLTPASDVCAAGRVMQHLVSGNDGTQVRRVIARYFGEKLTAFIKRCTHVDPSKRPADGTALLAELRALALVPVIEAGSHANLRVDDPVEERLLDAVWQQPTDEHARAVYGDWLEQHGHASRRELLQRELDDGFLAPADDIAWRAIVSRAPINQCPRLPKCGGGWHTLARTRDDRRRHCMTCDHAVSYCASLEDAYEIGSDRVHSVFVVDAGTPRKAATDMAHARYAEISSNVDGRHPYMARPGPPRGFCPGCNHDAPLDVGCEAHGPSRLIPIEVEHGYQVCRLGGYRIGQWVEASNRPYRFLLEQDRGREIWIADTGEPLPDARFAGIDSPHLIRVHDAGSDRGWSYVMRDHPPQLQELDHTQSLEARYDLAGQLLAAIAAIHARGVVHGGITAQAVRQVPGRGLVLLTGAPPDSRFLSPAILAGGEPTFDDDLIAAGRVIHLLLSSWLPDETLARRMVNSKVHPAICRVVDGLALGSPELLALGAEGVRERWRHACVPQPWPNPPAPAMYRPHLAIPDTPPPKPGAFVRIKNWFRKR